ncbi:glycosyltransferase [Ornithinimicrobium cryptoxanthini]|uniref:glycosyltransferase n=1 Tax=Ornithinimicrobium cryptoxanthini TaxID=2934161 RepID=UPI002117FA01|nr:glycosyltransferase [Ornithinimicrobium cryptoxanthini]
MGAYNCADTLPEALESIAAQTYPHWELVVCDDGSTDSTFAVLQGFAQTQEGRVTVLQNSRNRQLAYSLNRCLEHAEGTLIARMDGDDLSCPARLERQVLHLRSHPEIDLVGSWMRRFDESGRHDIVKVPPAPDRWSLRRDAPFAHATIMVRREVYATLEGYTVSERTARNEDYDLWFRFFHAGFRGENLPEALYLVREDEAAARRRSVKHRWNAYRTTLVGYRMLGYPSRWLVRPTLLTLIKSAVPTQLYLRYRRQQAAAEHRPGSRVI